MARTMKGIAIGAAILTFVSAIFFSCFSWDVYLSLAITFGTITYHFSIRLLIGTLFQLFMKNRADYRKKWYHLHPWESVLYQKLRVKKWKDKMPSYDRDSFYPALHSWNEIAQAMCQSELVHEMDIVFSFLPLFFSVWFGAFPVFLTTSIFAAAYDSLFVMMQRYNRPRILRIIEKH